jgi:hypothetical protein
MSRSRRRLLVLAVPAAALAAASVEAAEKGQIGLSAATSNNYSVAFQVSDRLSLRPSFSLGHSTVNGWFFGVGGMAYHHLQPGRRLSPYVGAGFAWHHSDPWRRPDRIGDLAVRPGFYLPADASRRYATFTGAAGLEFSINRRFSVFAELDSSYSTGRHYDFSDGAWRPDSGPNIRPLFGVTLKLR